MFWCFNDCFDMFILWLINFWLLFHHSYFLILNKFGIFQIWIFFIVCAGRTARRLRNLDYPGTHFQYIQVLPVYSGTSRAPSSSGLFNLTLTFFYNYDYLLHFFLYHFFISLVCVCLLLITVFICLMNILAFSISPPLSCPVCPGSSGQT